ncbi:MAG: hypothetical protein ACLT98_00715 [Eggerthellaceae bacterium]
MSTYKEQDIEPAGTPARASHPIPSWHSPTISASTARAPGTASRSGCTGTSRARYGKDDKVIYDPFDTLPGRSLKSSGGLPMVEFYLHRGDDRPDATRNVRTWSPAYLIGRYYMKRCSPTT